MSATLKWFSLATDAEPDVVTYTGNFKIEGDVEISGLVRRGNQIFDAITPQWAALANFPGRIYYSPGLNKDPNNLYTSSSISSVDLGSISGVVGPLYIGAGLDYEVGDLVKFIYKEDSTKFFKIIVVGYNKNTGGIAGTLTETSGTGTYNSWNVYLFDPQTRVGIGTLNPSYALDVNGDIRYTGKLFRDTSEVNFGLGAWIASNLVNDNTIFYGGSGTRVGIGSGFGSTLLTQTASGTLHIWDELSTGSWNAYYGLRVGPEESNKNFVQYGVTNESHGWIQSARTGTALGSHIPQPITINPVGGNVGIGTAGFTNSGLLTLNHANLTENKYPNNIYRAIEITRGEEQMNIINSNRMGIMFDDRITGTSDPKLHFLADNGVVSWKINDWPSSCIMTMSSTGNVGIGTTNPESSLHIQSQGTCSIILNNTGLFTDITPYGISRNNEGLVFGTYAGLGNVNNNMILNNQGLKVNSGNIDCEGEFRINGTTVLQGTSLGPNVLNSNLRTLGVLSQNLVNTAGYVSNLGAGYAHFMLDNTSGDLQIGLGLSGDNNFTIYSYPGGLQRMTVKRSNGYVGIGTNDPNYPLEINSGVSQTVSGPITAYYYSFYGVDTTNPLTGFYSMKASNIIAAQGFYAYSDKRIKKNISETSGYDAISLVRKLQPVSYEYIDRFKGGRKYGFIAQDVKSHVPEAVTHIKDFIPNVYTLVDIGKDLSTIIMNDTSSITEGSRLRFVMKDGSYNDMKVIRLENNVVELNEKLPEDYDKIFLYGTEVEDFHQLDDMNIVSINTAAIKELDRENQELKRRVESLEAKLEMLMSRMNVSQ